MTDLAHHEAEFLLYQTEDGRTRVEVRFDGETARLSLGQRAELFQRDKSVISRHIKNVFDEGELSPEATVTKFATVQREGVREVTREVEYFNLDVIIRISHDEAVAKAAREYDRFATARAQLPAPVEQHFEDAVRNVKHLERARRAAKSAKAPVKPRKKP